MPLVDKYHVWFYGRSASAKGVPAKVALYEGSGLAGHVHFHDTGMTIPTDSQATSGEITMHLPVAMLPYVVDILRNEKPITYDFAGGKAVLGTAAPEPVGEGE